jgi:hypothetical protein
VERASLYKKVEDLERQLAELKGERLTGGNEEYSSKPWSGDVASSYADLVSIINGVNRDLQTTKATVLDHINLLQLIKSLCESDQFKRGVIKFLPPPYNMD